MFIYKRSGSCLACGSVSPIINIINGMKIEHIVWTYKTYIVLSLEIIFHQLLLIITNINKHKLR